MKIAITALDMPSEGGINTYLNNLLEQTPSDEKCHIFILETKKDQLTGHRENIIIETIPSVFENLIFRMLFVQIVLPIILWHKKFDVVFSPTGDYTCILTPLPTVLIIHDFSPFLDSLSIDVSRSVILEWKFKIQKLFTILSSKYSNVVIFPSEFSKEICVPQLEITQGKATVISHGVDLKKFSFCDQETQEICILGSNDTKLPSNEKYILSVSTLYKHKNFETLIQAYSRLDENIRKKYALVIAGSAPSDQHFQDLRLLCKRQGVENNVHFLGGVDYDYIPSLYRNASLYVLPSKLETFGLTTIESMACGTPVIAANSTAIPEVVQGAGDLFEPDNVDELQKKIEKLLIDHKARQKLILKGLERAEESSWESTAKKTWSVIKELK